MKKKEVYIHYKGIGEKKKGFTNVEMSELL